MGDGYASSFDNEDHCMSVACTIYSSPGGQGQRGAHQEGSEDDEG